MNFGQILRCQPSLARRIFVKTSMPLQRFTGSGCTTGKEVTVYLGVKTQTRGVCSLHHCNWKLFSAQKGFSGMLFGGVQGQRGYKRKKTVKIPPTKPLSFDYGGDIVKDLQPLDVSQPRPGFEDIEELQDADEQVKRILSLEYCDSQEVMKKRLDDIKAKIQEHPADIYSREVSIATLTITIRNRMRHCLEFRKDKVAKAILVEQIQERTKLLKELRVTDMEKFTWLCEELGLQYIKQPGDKKPSKRVARINAARQEMFAVKKKKMEDFREKVAKEREIFMVEKEQEMERIDKELKEIGVNMDEATSLDDLFQKMGLGEPYVKKKEPKKKSRQLILEAKFAEHFKNLKKSETTA